MNSTTDNALLSLKIVPQLRHVSIIVGCCLGPALSPACWVLLFPVSQIVLIAQPSRLRWRIAAIFAAKPHVGSSCDFDLYLISSIVAFIWAANCFALIEGLLYQYDKKARRRHVKKLQMDASHMFALSTGAPGSASSFSKMLLWPRHPLRRRA